MTFLRSLWLDAVIGWNEGTAIKARDRAEKANARALRAQAAWNDLNPHPFNRRPCLIHMEPDVNHCRGCADDRWIDTPDGYEHCPRCHPAEVAS